MKKTYKSKEGDRTLNRLMNRIYTDLSTEYDKKVYNPSESSQSEDPKADISKPELDKNASDNTEDDSSKPKSFKSERKQWSNIEIVKLLVGINVLGEPKWQEIKNSMELHDKTAHDISIKWMDLRYQIQKQQRSDSNSHKRQNSSAHWKGLDSKNSPFLRNGEMNPLPTTGKNWLVKSDKKILTSTPGRKGGYNEIPILDNPGKSAAYFNGQEDDPEMSHYISLANRGIKIFKITKNASRDDYSDSDSDFGGRHKRRRLNEDGEYETCSDFTDY